MNAVINTSILAYVSAGKEQYNEWRLNELESFVPNDRQKPIIAAVQSALDAKCYYTAEVLSHCIKSLGITQEQALVGTDRVEGGDVGMDVYYARRYIDAQAKFAKERRALELLSPVVGLDLGVLIFNDFKRNTGMKVTAVSEDRKEITVQGKRGRYIVTMKCTALQIINAINRAHEGGNRKNGIEFK